MRGEVTIAMNSRLDIELSEEYQFADGSGCVGTHFHDQGLYDGM